MNSSRNTDAVKTLASIDALERLLVSNRGTVAVVIGSEHFHPCADQLALVREVASDADLPVCVAYAELSDVPQMKESFGIEGVPTILLFRGGHLEQRLDGIQEKSDIESALDPGEDR